MIAQPDSACSFLSKDVSVNNACRWFWGWWPIALQANRTVSLEIVKLCFENSDGDILQSLDSSVRLMVYFH